MTENRNMHESDIMRKDDHTKSSTMASSSEDNESNDDGLPGQPVFSSNRTDAIQNTRSADVNCSPGRKILKPLRCQPNNQHKKHDSRKKILNHSASETTDDRTNVTTKLSPREDAGEKNEPIMNEKTNDIKFKGKRKTEGASRPEYDIKRGLVNKRKQLFQESTDAIKQIQNLDCDITTIHEDDKIDKKINFNIWIKQTNVFTFGYSRENEPYALMKHTRKKRSKYKNDKQTAVKYCSEEEFSQYSLDKFWSVVKGDSVDNKCGKHSEREQTIREMIREYWTKPTKVQYPKKLEKPDNSNGSKCDFCSNTSVYCCENCTYVYCDECLLGLHPSKGPYLSHSVVPVSFISQTVRCEIHGAAAKLYCVVCKKHRCQECVGSICQLHFQNKVHLQDMQEEKTKILADIEKLAHVLGSLNVYEDQAEEETIETEMTALYRKDQIRQEFVSFHDLLIKCEELVLAQLDEDVRRRLSCAWRGNKDTLEELRKDEATITANTLNLIQTEDKDDFIQGTAGIRDRYWSLQKKAESFHKDWTQASATNDRQRSHDLIEQPFSLYQEKKTLFESIGKIRDRCPLVSFRQKTLIIISRKPFHLVDYVDQTLSGPSMTACYNVKLCSRYVTGKMSEVWRTKVNSLKEVVLNTPESIFLQDGITYLLKLQGTTVCHLSQSGRHETEYEPTHMLITVSYPSIKNNHTEI